MGLEWEVLNDGSMDRLEGETVLVHKGGRYRVGIIRRNQPREAAFLHCINGVEHIPYGLTLYLVALVNPPSPRKLRVADPRLPL